MIYAILDSEGKCINRIMWDGITEWQPPEGCKAVADPHGLYQIYAEPIPASPEDPLTSLSDEQKQALLALLQQ